MTLDEEIRQGEHAERLLGDDLLNDVFRTIREECFERWGQSGAEQGETRESLYRFFKMADCVKRELEKRRDAGRMAKSKVEAEQRAREFERERGFRPHI